MFRYFLLKLVEIYRHCSIYWRTFLNKWSWENRYVNDDGLKSENFYMTNHILSSDYDNYYDFKYLPPKYNSAKALRIVNDRTNRITLERPNTSALRWMNYDYGMTLKMFIEDSSY